jgi:EPS-associated MarR family transcriptional regulator
MSKETHYKLLRRLEKNADATQRELAQDVGVSLGKLNYCLKKLIEKGWVKANNFHNNPNKSSYRYLLTPSGIDAKTRLTVQFLKRKLEEYDRLQQEILSLEEELERLGDNGLLQGQQSENDQDAKEQTQPKG